MQQNEIQTSQVPWKIGTYSVKRHGTTTDNCAAEPINTPGCIQVHGALLGLRVSDLNILQVSENSAAWLGVPPETLLGRPVSIALGLEGERQLRDCLTNAPLECNPLHAFSLPKTQVAGLLAVSIHTIGGVAIIDNEEIDLDKIEINFL